jgi:hypothetical protein
MNAVITNGALFVGFAPGTNIFSYSYNGNIWITVSGAVVNSVTAVAWSGQVFAAGAAGGVNDSKFYFSYDGINWITASISILTPISATVNSIVWTGTQFVAGTTSGIYTSPDGNIWTGAGVSGVIKAVAYSSNVVPDLTIGNLSFNSKQQSIYNTVNTVQLMSNGMLLNQLYTGTGPGFVGVLCNSPQTALGVGGTIASLAISSASASFSTLSTQSATISTLFTHSATISTATISSLFAQRAIFSTASI